MEDGPIGHDSNKKLQYEEEKGPQPEEQNSSFILEFPRKPSKIELMKAIYKADPLKPARSRELSKEQLRVPLKPAAERPKRPVHRKFVTSAAAGGTSTDRRSKSPILLEPLQKTPQKPSQTGTTSPNLQKKRLI